MERLTPAACIQSLILASSVNIVKPFAILQSNTMMKEAAFIANAKLIKIFQSPLPPRISFVLPTNQKLTLHRFQTHISGYSLQNRGEIISVSSIKSIHCQFSKGSFPAVAFPFLKCCFMCFSHAAFKGASSKQSSPLPFSLYRQHTTVQWKTLLT